MRPHIEFIQQHWLPFEPGVLPHARPDLDARVLSRDTESGACSLILRYPPGWSRGAERLEVDEELLVLEGALEIGDVSYQRHDYAHLRRGLGRAGLGPWWHCDTQETHPVAEEEFALAGDIHMPNGVLREGGVYSTVFTPAPRPFAWDPVYRPVVPDQYRRWIPPERFAAIPCLASSATTVSRCSP